MYAVFNARVETKSGPAAIEGTACHSVLEDAVLRGADPSSFVGKRIQTKDGPVIFSEENARSVSTAVSAIRSFQDASKVLWSAMELRVEIPGTPVFGRGDYFQIDEEGTLTVLDFKNGRIDVAVEANPQCFCYAVGVLSHPSTARFLPSLTRVRFVIVQPNAFAGKAVKQVVYPISVIGHFHAMLLRFFEIVADESALTTNAGTWCTYCPANGLCESTQDQLKQAASLLCSDIRNLHTRGLEQLFLAKASIQNNLKLAEATLLERGLGGEELNVPIVTSTKHRQWRDEEQIKGYALQKYGLRALTLITPARLESFGAEAAEFVKQHTQVPPGDPKLDKPGSKLPPYTRRSASDMFT